MIRRHIRFSSVKQRNSVRDWKNKLQGIPCFVLGNGPSLGDIDLSSLSPFFTIGINRIFYLFDPTILFWQDIELWHAEKKNILEQSAIKVCRDVADPQNRFYHFRITGGSYKIPDYPNFLYGRASTGPLAVQFAYILGCDPIILLGCDCKPRGNDTDFYGKNKHHFPHTMTNCRKGLEWIKKEIASKRVVYSCSDNDIFEKTNLNDIINNLDKNHKQQRNYWYGKIY